ncbi:alpha/beta hydrolase [Nocardioides sp. WS12]|uniref:alpha/beta hydrolase n=1 Tax=Nocardioides sp. WS12 TaxID=2486272 RepID=UPI0015FBCBEF|nr:alpha/beta hydrolase [Nocardioides sp. WS12]
MVTIELPRAIDPVPAMESTAVRAATFANNLRAVAVQVKDVQAWAESQGVPDGWQGDAREAADHGTTRFARRVDVSEAALERAITAADRFEDRLVRLGTRRIELAKRRTTLNDDVETLRAEIEGNEAVEVNVAGWERRAAGLRSRATDLLDDITAWIGDDDDAEDEFVRALQHVDEIAEGRRAAQDPDRPDPDALGRAFDRRVGDPVALAAWWRTLSRAQKQALLAERPHEIGNADGIPVSDRDEANRAAVYSDIDRLTRQEADGVLTDEERAILDNAKVIREELNGRMDDVDPLTGEHLVHVIVYKPGEHGGDGGVAISFGDPDRADHVSVNVPGLTSETSSLPGNLARTEDLHGSALGQTDGTVASIFWLDYDAPSGNPVGSVDDLLDFGSVIGPGAADRGGERFSDFVDGLRASDEGDRAHLTVIGHSYGSTTVGHALQDGLPVDDAILIGSPGVPEYSAAALTDADVWVGAKDNDPVSLLGAQDGPGTLGGDPAQESFGATRFETGDGSSRIQDALDNHTSYFEGDSLHNLGAIVVNQDDNVIHDEERERWTDEGHYQTLPEYLVESSIKGAGGPIVDGVEQWGRDFIDSLSRGFGPGRFL